MGQMADATNHLYEFELLGVAYVKDADIEFKAVARDWRTALISKDAEARNRFLDSAKKHLGALHASIEKARPLFVTPKGKELVGKVGNSWPCPPGPRRRVSAPRGRRP